MIWYDIAPAGVDDFDFARDLLRDKKILVNYGSGFGPSGKNHVRIVFLPEFSTLKECYEDILDFKKNYTEPGQSKPKYMVH